MLPGSPSSAASAGAAPSISPLSPDSRRFANLRKTGLSTKAKQEINDHVLGPLRLLNQRPNEEETFVMRALIERIGFLTNDYLDDDRLTKQLMAKAESELVEQLIRDKYASVTDLQLLAQLKQMSKGDLIRELIETSKDHMIEQTILIARSFFQIETYYSSIKEEEIARNVLAFGRCFVRIIHNAQYPEEPPLALQSPGIQSSMTRLLREATIRLLALNQISPYIMNLIQQLQNTVKVASVAAILQLLLSAVQASTREPAIFSNIDNGILKSFNIPDIIKLVIKQLEGDFSVQIFEAAATTLTVDERKQLIDIIEPPDAAIPHHALSALTLADDPTNPVAAPSNPASSAAAQFIEKRPGFLKRITSRLLQQKPVFVASTAAAQPQPAATAAPPTLIAAQPPQPPLLAPKRSSARELFPES